MSGAKNNVEEWRDIPGFEELYQVSSLGRVRSLDRIVDNKQGGTYSIKGRIMSQVENGTGYKFLILCKNGLHNRRYVHRLVASAFIPNPHDFRYVNHKDENKSNNKVSNLEWCNMAYNNAYGSRTSRYISTRSKAVLQYDLAGNLIGEYSSATEASQATGIYRRSICSCCNGRYLSAGGYKWKYKNQ